MSKRRIRLLCLFAAAVLLFSALGALLLRRDTDNTVPIVLTVKNAHADNALALSLPRGTFAATIDGIPCRILSFSAAPSELCEVKDGDPFPYPSRLFSDITVTLSVEATVREGVLYAADAFLSVGKRVLLSSPVFYGFGEITSIKVGEVA